MYLLSDIKKIIFNKVVIVISVLLTIIMVLDPISVYWQANQYTNFFDEIGSNPFQFWLLINTAGWGNTVFNVIFWALPMIIVACVYHYEQSSSVSMFLMVRKSKIKYFLSKAASVFLITLLLFSLLLVINVLVTYSIFPNTEHITEQYEYYTPSMGTFAYELYKISPLFMAIGFCLINAGTLSVIGVFYLAIQILFKFKNKYIAIVLPIVIVYGLTFLLDSFTPLWHFNLSLFIQPMAASSLTELLTFKDLGFTFFLWTIVDVAILTLGIMRNRDVL